MPSNMITFDFTCQWSSTQGLITKSCATFDFTSIKKRRPSVWKALTNPNYTNEPNSRMLQKQSFSDRLYIIKLHNTDQQCNSSNFAIFPSSLDAAISPDINMLYSPLCLERRFIVLHLFVAGSASPVVESSHLCQSFRRSLHRIQPVDSNSFNMLGCGIQIFSSGVAT